MEFAYSKDTCELKSDELTQLSQRNKLPPIGHQGLHSADPMIGPHKTEKIVRVSVVTQQSANRIIGIIGKLVNVSILMNLLLSLIVKLV